MKAVSVSQVNSYIKRVLATDPILCNIACIGEISNLTKHSSGHWYFVLKDENSKINCFLPSSRVEQLRFDLAEGMEVTVFGSVSVYEKGGYYSLQVRDVQAEGEGNLKLAFENLKNKLQSEGLFDEKNKKTIPKNPKQIGVVTSPTGAAIRDIISTIRRRNPFVDILLYPALVQGDGAAASVSEGIKTFNERFPNIDLLIIGRGGGSIEDLWAFNEEKLARAVFESKIPIISAVGHEIDWVITDYVADLRGATPTAAAELAVPHIENYKDKLSQYNPHRTFSLIENRVLDSAYKLESVKRLLDTLNPSDLLSKGYAMVKNSEGVYLSKSCDLKEGEIVNIIFSDGEKKAKILGN